MLGKHGMVLSKQGRSAVFLPQVAPEQGWDIDQTLTHLSMKAGLPPDAWKDVFSSAMKRTKVVPGLDGGFVVCGQSTSKMTIAEMCEMQDLMEAFGAQKGVRFTAQEVEA